MAPIVEMQESVDRRPPVMPIGLAPLARMAFEGADMNPVWEQAIARMTSDPSDVAALMDLSTIALLCGQRAEGIGLQARALERERLYRRPARGTTQAPLRLLAFLAPGDFMANTPLEFLLENSDVTLDMLYMLPGAQLPDMIPEHDIAIVAISQSDENRAFLHALGPLVEAWRRPLLNRPDRIERLSRDGTWEMLRDSAALSIPQTARIARADLSRLALGDLALTEHLAGADFPIIARPIDSHAGIGLAKLDDAASVAVYLEGRSEDEFYVSPFVDYRSADGLFRKYRVALIGGVPFASHMAISRHWMIHYLNADMRENADRRAEEARFMAGFDDEFARRHAGAWQAIADRTGLDYVTVDCGEMPDGRLLVFEADVAMIVHAMDPPDLFPYKRPQMDKLMTAFRALLKARAGRGPEAEVPAPAVKTAA